MTADEDKAKLEHLLGHWIEHNKSHADTFNEWAERAAEMGEGATSEYIEIAVEQMQEANRFLSMALKALKQ